jgi:hypothetical protein
MPYLNAIRLDSNEAIFSMSVGYKISYYKQTYVCSDVILKDETVINWLKCVIGVSLKELEKKFNPTT